MAKSKITVELTLKDGSKLILDKNKIKNIESLSQTNADASTIFYGVLASSGRLEILDYDGTIKRYIQEGIIDTSAIKVDIYINGVLSQRHISADSNYANETSIMTIELTNKLSLWDTINYSGYYYPEKPETAYEMLKNILVSIGYEVDYIDNVMLSDYTFDSDNNMISIKSYLESIKIQYPYLPADTLRSTIDKFCTLAQLNVVLNSDGEIKFINARPLVGNMTKIIQVPLNKQYGDFSYSVILKNKYDAIEMNEYMAKQVSDYETVIGAFNSNTDTHEVQQVSDSDESSTTVGNQTNSKAYMSILYYYGNITLNRRSNLNLKYISKIYTGLDDDKKPYTKHSVNYTHYKGTWDGMFPSYNESSDGSGTFATYDEISYKYYNASITKSDLTNLNDLPVIITDDELKISFKVIAGKTTYGYYYQYTPPVGTTGSGTTLINSEANAYDPKEVEISFYGDIREITFTESSVSSENVSEALNPFNLDTSELFQQVTKVGETKISDIVKSNILSDYSNGISNGSIIVATTDYFDKNGDKIIDVSKGQTISIGDVLKIKGDNRYWRVTGANQRKSGTPYIDLEVMEVKKIQVNSLWVDLGRVGANGYLKLGIVESNNFSIDWGDGTKNEYTENTNIIEHTYSNPQFEGWVNIYGNFNGLMATEGDYPPYVEKIIYDINIREIPDYALEEYSSLTNIDIPDSIINIGVRAFAFCSELESIILPDSVEKISSGAFLECTSLANAKIGDGIKTIESSAFADCNGLTNVYIGNGLNTIGAWAFKNCSSLKTINIPNTIEYIGRETFDGDDRLIYNRIDTNDKGLYLGEKTNPYVVLMSINDKNITTYSIPSDCRIIYHNVFSGSKITNIELPDNIKHIGNDAFYECTNLKGQLKLPKNLKYIGDWAFYQCINITGELVIPEPITSIEQYAFGNTGINNLVFLGKVKTIGEGAFSGCSYLESIVFPNASLTGIGKYAFDYCISLNEIEIPEGVTWVGDSAFQSCTGLKKVTLSESLTSLGNYAFARCSNLESITIPSGIKTIKESVFEDCIGLKNVVLENGVDYIGYCSFSGCKSITNIIIPNSVTGIGRYSFQLCEGLTAINIPDSVVEVNEGAFFGCSGLKTAVIGSGVTQIGEYAFYDCVNLETITINTTTPPTLGGTRAIPDTITTIYVQSGTLSAYQTATNWSNYADKFVEM